jgi:hypothetical protein
MTSAGSSPLSPATESGLALPAICVGYPPRTEMQLKRSGTNIAIAERAVLNSRSLAYRTRMRKEVIVIVHTMPRPCLLASQRFGASSRARAESRELKQPTWREE